MDSLTFLYIHDILEKICGRVLPVFNQFRWCRWVLKVTLWEGRKDLEVGVDFWRLDCGAWWEPEDTGDIVQERRLRQANPSAQAVRREEWVSLMVPSLGDVWWFAMDGTM